MVEKNARICDVCDKHVARCKCEICNRDICEECTDEILNFLDDASLFNIKTCERCKRQISRVCLADEKVFEEVLKDRPELKNEIIETIKNVLMLKKITEEDVEKEKEKPSIITSPIMPRNRNSPFTTFPAYPPYYNKKLKKQYSNNLNDLSISHHKMIHTAQPKKKWWSSK